MISLCLSEKRTTINTERIPKICNMGNLYICNNQSDECISRYYFFFGFFANVTTFIILNLSYS